MKRALTPEFHSNLAQRMRELGIKPLALAAKLGVNANQVYRWQKNQMPERDALEKIAAALDVPWQWLLVGDDGAKALQRYRGPAAVADTSAPDGASVSPSDHSEGRGPLRPRKTG